MFYPEKKQYISPSAIQLFLTNKKQFITSYFEGRKFTSPAMELGTQIHKDIEKGLLPVENFFKFFEHKIEIETPVEGLRMIGYLDGWDGAGKFVDYKTGKRDTALSAVYSVKQELYAYMLFKLNPELEKVEGIIEWVEVQDGAPTGKTESMPAIFERDIVEHWDKKIPEIVADINKTYIDFMETRVDYEPEILTTAEQLAEIVRQKKELERKEKELKVKLEKEMEEKGYQDIKTGDLNIFYTERKIYELPEEAQKKEEEFKQYIKRIKQELEKEGKFKITKSLTVRI